MGRYRMASDAGSLGNSTPGNCWRATEHVRDLNQDRWPAIERHFCQSQEITPHCIRRESPREYQLDA